SKHTLAGRVLGVGEIDFMFRRNLPGEADGVVARVIAVVCAPGQVRLIEQRALQLVVVIAGLIDGSIILPERAEEPELVLFDRTANASSNVIILPDRRRTL